MKKLLLWKHLLLKKLLLLKKHLLLKPLLLKKHLLLQNKSQAINKKAGLCRLFCFYRASTYFSPAETIRLGGNAHPAWFAPQGRG